MYLQFRGTKYTTEQLKQEQDLLLVAYRNHLVKIKEHYLQRAKYIQLQREKIEHQEMETFLNYVSSVTNNFNIQERGKCG
jgi:hypothetical protein